MELRLEQAEARYPFSELPDAAAIRGTWPPAADMPMGHAYLSGRSDPPALAIGSSVVPEWYLDMENELQLTSPALPAVSLPYWEQVTLTWSGGPVFEADSSLLLYTPAYDAWAAATFPGGTPAADTLPDANPDGDRMPNFAEFALGRDPLVFDGADHQALNGDQFSFRIHKSATDVLVSIEVSDVLTNWHEHQLQNIGLTLSDPDPDGTGNFNEWTVTLPDPGNPVFVRLKLVHF